MSSYSASYRRSPRTAYCRSLWIEALQWLLIALASLGPCAAPSFAFESEGGGTFEQGSLRRLSRTSRPVFITCVLVCSCSCVYVLVDACLLLGDLLCSLCLVSSLKPASSLACRSECCCLVAVGAYKAYLVSLRLLVAIPHQTSSAAISACEGVSLV